MWLGSDLIYLHDSWLSQSNRKAYRICHEQVIVRQAADEIHGSAFGAGGTFHTAQHKAVAVPALRPKDGLGSFQSGRTGL